MRMSTRPAADPWHDLRHTSLALAIADSAHPKAIQERMGHASITVTLDRYGDHFPSLGLQVAEGLEASQTKEATVTPLDSRFG